MSARAADRPPAPKLPLAQWWLTDLGAPVAAGPVSDESRVYVALKTAELVAFNVSDGSEAWRFDKDVSLPMAIAGDRLIVASNGAIEALRGFDYARVWIAPGLTPVAPMVARDGWIFVVTDTEIVAIRSEDGAVAWRHSSGGVVLPPVLDGDRLYVGAKDGKLAALSVKDGSQAWERFYDGGITALAASKGLVYIGAGDKILYCVNASNRKQWPYRLGAYAINGMAVDEERIYVAASNNVVRGLDRRNGNQRWKEELRQRPAAGTFAIGHVVFVPVAAWELAMLYDYNGRLSGVLHLPGETPAGLAPDFRETEDGAIVYVVTGSLTNEWSLTKFAPAGEAALVSIEELTALPGDPYLTDPVLAPIGNVLGPLILSDPPLQSLEDLGWPVVLRDPPLGPLTVLPGVQLRPLSPTLPVRRGASGPGG